MPPPRVLYRVRAAPILRLLGNRSSSRPQSVITSFREQFRRAESHLKILVYPLPPTCFWTAPAQRPSRRLHWQAGTTASPRFIPRMLTFPAAILTLLLFLRTFRIFPSRSAILPAPRCLVQAVHPVLLEKVMTTTARWLRSTGTQEARR